MSTLRRMFEALTVRNFRLFAAGQLLSVTCTWMMFIAQDWLVLSLSGDSATALGLVTALQFTPMLLLTLYGGRLADRHDKRRLLVAANLAAGVLALLLAVLTFTGGLRLWHIWVFAAALGTVNAMEAPARMAFVSEMVGAALLPNASALSAAYFNAARVVGPALAGLLISRFDAGPVIALNAVSYLASVCALLLMDPAELVRPAERPGRTGVLDGLRYLRGRSDLMLPLALVGVIGMFGFNFQLTLPLMAKTVFHADSASFGLLASTGRGFAARRVRHDRPAEPAVRRPGHRGRRRLRGTGDPFRAGPDLRRGAGAAGRHGLRDDLLRAGRQPPGAAGHRSALPGPGDGPLHADPPGLDPAGGPPDRLAQRTLGSAGRPVRRGVVSLAAGLLALWAHRRRRPPAGDPAGAASGAKVGL
ncbi:MFS transporter [Streptomyces thinghirensis]|nr:MFS transporter [Streptomyces thinghirensis]